ncbi:uncharacterized protein [Typha latifolia]|uniref:uncharacterized protein isoform X1 n=2 Tax=Typha latifolia TaxID=4733 RepID=UPI003C2E1610
MDETLASDAIRKRLNLQSEVLKWLVDFSKELEDRSKSTAAEINGLLDEAGIMEIDMKNTVISFNNLSYDRFIDHKVSDEDDMSSNKENKEASGQLHIHAQDYELDILPRYKEALSLGLTSCKNHLENKSCSSSSIFTTMSAHSMLPHVIGSEEYIHDNTCGLTDDFTSPNLPDDFSWVWEFKSISSDAEAPDLFGSHMLGMPHGFNKDETEPLVSAALDFKAMLEAALLNPYKFYDEESVLAHDASTDNKTSAQTEKNVNTVMSRGQEDVSSDSFQQEDVKEEGLTYAKYPEGHAHELYPGLITESLFDAEDEPVSLDQKESADMSASTSCSTSQGEGTVDSAIPAESTLSRNDQFSTDPSKIIVHTGTGTFVSTSEIGDGKKTPEEKPILHEDESSEG